MQRRMHVANAVQKACSKHHAKCMQRCAGDAFTLRCASWHALVLSWVLCLLQLNGAMTEAFS
eukprot:1154595-Pelagomonas_calceolata.AAC.11